jgi:hypothetical protein
MQQGKLAHATASFLPKEVPRCVWERKAGAALASMDISGNFVLPTYFLKGG